MLNVGGTSYPGPTFPTVSAVTQWALKFFSFCCDLYNGHLLHMVAVWTDLESPDWATVFMKPYLIRRAKSFIMSHVNLLTEWEVIKQNCLPKSNLCVSIGKWSCSLIILWLLVLYQRCHGHQRDGKSFIKYWHGSARLYAGSSRLSSAFWVCARQALRCRYSQSRQHRLLLVNSAEIHLLACTSFEWTLCCFTICTEISC